MASFEYLIPVFLSLVVNLSFYYINKKNNINFKSQIEEFFIVTVQNESNKYKTSIEKLFRKLKKHSLSHKNFLDKLFTERVQLLKLQNTKKYDSLEMKPSLFLKNQRETALVVYQPNPRFWI